MMPEGGGGYSYSDVSSATASLTQGAKSSGLTIAAPVSTSSSGFLSEALSARYGTADSGGGNTAIVVAVVAVVALILLRKGGK